MVFGEIIRIGSPKNNDPGGPLGCESANEIVLLANPPGLTSSRREVFLAVNPRRLRSDRRNMKRAPSPSLVISVLALFVALSGSAYAAAKINGKNIKKGTVTGKQIKNGTITRSDLSKKLSVAGPTGASGKDGKDGVSILDDTLPSGKTITGHWSVAEGNGAPAQQTYYTTIDFPVKAPVALDDAHVNFKSNAASTTDADPACSGTTVDPTAPPGKVCLYNSVQGYYNAPPLLTAGKASLADKGFLITLAVKSGESYSAYGSWAYTAP